MKRITICPLVCLLAVVLAACGAAAATPNATPQGAAKAQEFTTAEGGFTVMAPVALAESRDIVSTAMGNLEVHTFAGGLGDTKYVVVYADYPSGYKAKSAQQLLDAARDAQVKGDNGTLAGEGPVMLNGYQGREIRITIPGAGSAERVVRGRLCWVGTRLYRVLVYTPATQADSPEATDFLTSFQLRDRAD